MSIFLAVILVGWLPPFNFFFIHVHVSEWGCCIWMGCIHIYPFLNVVTTHPWLPTDVVTMAILHVLLWTHNLIEIIKKKKTKKKKKNIPLEVSPSFLHIMWLVTLTLNLNHLIHLQNQPITDADTARLKSTAFWLQNMRAEPGLKFNFCDCATETRQSNNWNMTKALKSYFCISSYWVTGLKSSKSHSQSNITLLARHTQRPQ